MAKVGDTFFWDNHRWVVTKKWSEQEEPESSYEAADEQGQVRVFTGTLVDGAIAHERSIHQLSNERVAERLRDFAAIALSDGRKHMATELKFLADREESSHG